MAARCRVVVVWPWWRRALPDGSIINLQLIHGANLTFTAAASEPGGREMKPWEENQRKGHGNDRKEREGGGFKEKRRERQRKSAAADGEGANNGGEKKESWQEWKNEGRVNRRSCTTPKLLWDQWVWSEVCVRARVCVYRSPRPPPPVVCLIKKKSLCVEGCWHPDGTKVCCRGSKTRGVDFYFRQSCRLWNELSGRRRSCDTGEDSGWCCIVIFGKKKKSPTVFLLSATIPHTDADFFLSLRPTRPVSLCLWVSDDQSVCTSILLFWRKPSFNQLISSVGLKYFFLKHL